MQQSNHENFTREEGPALGSDRSFGFVMAAALSILALLSGWHSGRLWPYLFVCALGFLFFALLSPSTLHPLNRLWMKFGLLLHRVVNPIIMGLLFYGTIYPTGVIMRLRGKDLLRLKREPDAASYWITRPPGPSPETMKDQF